ncbi:hypothetical protein [Halovivax cerinus]|uniref:Uncharacterized protein n=1 Tax=Halovivax cerinus TaxID=1487865 RepID=A0ABD5NTI1_9EURY|nr:hypothetical protein [Halovivax cerinus]
MVDASVLRATLVVLRDRPRVFVPFLALGLLGGGTTLARLASPIALAPARFPERGYVHLPVSFVPDGQAGLEYGPGAISGLKPQFLAFLVGLDLAVVLATTVAFAIGLWTVADGTSGHVPPVGRVCWLVSYVLVVEGALLVATYASWAGVGGTGTALVVLLVGWPISVGLFPAPAYVVLDGDGPIGAVRESVALVTDRFAAIVAVVVLLGYAGYVMTGVAVVAPDPTVGAALGTVFSTTVVGTVHAVVVFVVYHQRAESSPG